MAAKVDTAVIKIEGIDDLKSCTVYCDIKVPVGQPLVYIPDGYWAKTAIRFTPRIICHPIDWYWIYYNDNPVYADELAQKWIIRRAIQQFDNAIRKLGRAQEVVIPLDLYREHDKLDAAIHSYLSYGFLVKNPGGITDPVDVI